MMESISILIVEDEALTAMLMKSMLRNKGFNVLKSVSTGEDAVDFSLKFKPDLVLMDIRLAGKMDGIEAVKKIKSESEKEIRFIFTTGYSDTELKDKTEELDSLGFFVKPVNIPEIVNVINKFFMPGTDS